jgi:hypothetical protein
MPLEGFALCELDAARVGDTELELIDIGPSLPSFY